MIDLKIQPGNLAANFHALKEVLRMYGPDSLHGIRERALARYDALGLPTLKDEEYKYLSLKLLQEGHFGPAYGATVDRNQLAQTGFGEIDAITLAFVNGQYAPELSSAHSLPDGVLVVTLADAFQTHDREILDRLGRAASLVGRLGTTNDERFVDLNTAYLGEGAFVFVPRGTVVERPIHLLWVSQANHGPFSSHPRNLIVLQEGAQAKIAESYVGLSGVYFTNSVSEAFLEKGSILEISRVQNESEHAVHISTTAVWQEASSTVTCNNVNFGGRLVRNDVNVWLNGEHTETWLNGASSSANQQVIDNHTRIDHAKPNCHSFETYKTILDDESHGVFNGKIFVYQDAQKTDAKQTNQTMLLSPHATINAKPQLEIFADDVKCTHGATIGQLREDALFYFRSRGIPLEQARALLVYAFAAEVLEKIGIQDLKALTERLLYRKLNLSQIEGTF